MHPIPDRLVVLTFDDGRRSDVELVGPLLARHGFGATFYITEGLGFEDKSRFLDWGEIRWLHDAGFEIGNHHGRHVAVDTQTREEFVRDLRHMEESCAAHGIPKPVTYCYPGGHHCRTAVEALHDAGHLFARRCCSPEHVDHADGAFGRAYAPGEDHPLLIPVAAIGGPAMDLDDLCAAVSTARDGRISVICLHGVPDDHTFCSTTPALFERFVDYLAGNDFTVIALRDLARYVDPWRRPADPYAPIRVRLCVHGRELTCEHRAGPADVDGVHPRFHWVLASDQRGQRQSSYQVLVASRREQLQPGRADRWDSGRVESGEPDVAYAGRPLANGETCWWTVRCWDAGGRPGPWAAPERFETGLVDPADRTGERLRAGSEASPDPLLGIAVPSAGRAARRPDSTRCAPSRACRPADPGRGVDQDPTRVHRRELGADSGGVHAEGDAAGRGQRLGDRSHAGLAGVPDRRARRAGLAAWIAPGAPSVAGGRRRRRDRGRCRRHLRVELGRLPIQGKPRGGRRVNPMPAIDRTPPAAPGQIGRSPERTWDYVAASIRAMFCR